MCRVRLRGGATLEVFPSLDCDDVRQIEVMDLDEGAELDIEFVEVDHGILFTFSDGRSSCLPLEAIELVTPCYWCDDSWHQALGARSGIK